MIKTKIQVQRLALEGEGVGRPVTDDPRGGKVAFVPYTLPGELVEASLVQEKKNHSRFLPIKILTPSPSRVKSKCPLHFQSGQEGPWCGGCDWQHMDSSMQRISKTQLLKETLIRLGGIPNPEIGEIQFSEKDWRYRNKVQVPFGFRGKDVIAGFYAPGTHTIVEFEDCPIQPEESVRIVQTIKKLVIAFKFSPYDEDRHRGWLRHVLVRTNESGQAIVVLVGTNRTFPSQSAFINLLREECPSVIGIFLNVQPARTHVILGREWLRLWGEDRLHEPVANLNLSYSPSSFFQVNSKAAELLYLEALRQLAPKNESVVLDLYCGVGAMTLLAAKVCKLAIGVEEAPSSIRDAIRNAFDNKISNVKFLEGKVERILRDPRALKIDISMGQELLGLIDPPRAGCDETVLRELMRLRPQRIVYVSCNPATLARDLKILSPQYRLRQVTPVDLFPQTSHIEAVAKLDRI